MLNTKFGKAKINNEGYYIITSRKEGNNGKLLHRLIWEDFWKTEVPKGYVIHHRDNNHLNNCILNLQLMRHGEHSKLHNIGQSNHMWGKHHSEETKIKMVKSHNNNSGYFNVSKMKSKSCKQGFTWKYQYYEDGKRKVISSVDIEKLKKKVKDKGLLWKEVI